MLLLPPPPPSSPLLVVLLADWPLLLGASGTAMAGLEHVTVASGVKSLRTSEVYEASSTVILTAVMP